MHNWERHPENLEPRPTVRQSLEAAVKSESKKATKAEAEYTNEGTDEEHCGNCKAYLGGNACAKVRGYVAYRGWCRLWTKRPKGDEPRHGMMMVIHRR